MTHVVIFSPGLTAQARYEIEQEYLPLTGLGADEVGWETSETLTAHDGLNLVIAVGEKAWRAVGGHGTIHEWRGFVR